MSNVNSVFMTGNAAMDPESTPSGKGVRLRVAVNQYNKEKRANEAQFFTVFFGGRTGEVCKEFVRKGDKVIITGSLATFRRQDDKYDTLMIYGNTLEWVSKGEPKPERERPSAARPVRVPHDDDEGDDIPF